MTEVVANGTRLYYEEHGEGTPILGIHGSGSSAIMWAAAVALAGSVEWSSTTGAATRAASGLSRSSRRHASRKRMTRRPFSMRWKPCRPWSSGANYGGDAAFELARRHPDHVKAIVGLEPGRRPGLDLVEIGTSGR